MDLLYIFASVNLAAWREVNTATLSEKELDLHVYNDMSLTFVEKGSLEGNHTLRLQDAKIAHVYGRKFTEYSTTVVHLQIV